MPEAYLPTEEWNALSEFKERLQDLNLSENPLLEDRRLINWLRARDLKLADAELMIRKHLKWRQDNDIDKILTAHNIPEEALNALPVDIVGEDKHGNPILAVYPGQMEIKLFVNKYGKDMAVKVFFHFLETAYQRLVEKSTDPNLFKQVVYIADIEGFRFKDYLSPDVLDVITTVLKCVEANYPEILYKAYVLNAPFIFPVLYNMVKPFMAQKTIEKATILGCNQEKLQNYLLELIPESQLPRKWGGSGFSRRIHELNMMWTSSTCEELGKNLKEVIVPSGEFYQISLDIKAPKTLLSWRFKTKKYDIGFTILRKGFDKDLDPVELFGSKRWNSSSGVQSGSLACETIGQYILRFDNTYSRFREKCLMHHVELTEMATNGNYKINTNTYSATS